MYKSPLCSCIICRDVKSSKGIHSHFLTAHTEDGNQLAKDRGKLGAKETAKFIAAENIKKSLYYAESPNYCGCCGVVLPLAKRNDKYCSKSCAAISNNMNREHDGWSQTELQRSIASLTHSVQRVCRVSFCVVCGAIIRNTNHRACSKTCRSVIFSNTAKNNPAMGGNKNNRAFGWYESDIAGRVYLESSYEHRVAQELDKHNIQWTRPPHLPYGNKKYFPDFYLTEYDVYLDPKNNYLIEKDKYKIEQVIEENGVKVIILDYNHLTWASIKSLI